MSDSDDDIEFKDIREGLRDRITLFEGIMAEEQEKFTAQQEKAAAAHKQTMDSYKTTILSYKRMLELEEGFAKHVEAKNAKVGPRSEDAPPEAKMPIPASRPPLAEFIVSEVAAHPNITK